MSRREFGDKLSKTQKDKLPYEAGKSYIGVSISVILYLDFC